MVHAVHFAAQWAACRRGSHLDSGGILLSANCSHAIFVYINLISRVVLGLFQKELLCARSRQPGHYLLGCGECSNAFEMAWMSSAWRWVLMRIGLEGVFLLPTSLFLSFVFCRSKQERPSVSLPSSWTLFAWLAHCDWQSKKPHSQTAYLKVKPHRNHCMDTAVWA
eukprot:1157900-Pelagomonas_calceolata.AAC.11